MLDRFAYMASLWGREHIDGPLRMVISLSRRLPVAYLPHLSGAPICSGSPTLWPRRSCDCVSTTPFRRHIEGQDLGGSGCKSTAEVRAETVRLRRVGPTLSWKFAESRCGNWFAHIFFFFSISVYYQNITQGRELPLEELLRRQIFLRKLRKFQNWRNSLNQNCLVRALGISESRSDTSSFVLRFALMRAKGDARTWTGGIGKVLAAKVAKQALRMPRGLRSGSA